MHCHVKKPDWGQSISFNVVGPNADHWSILVSPKWTNDLHLDPRHHYLHSTSCSCIIIKNIDMTLKLHQADNNAR